MSDYSMYKSQQQAMALYDRLGFLEFERERLETYGRDVQETVDHLEKCLQVIAGVGPELDSSGDKEQDDAFDEEVRKDPAAQARQFLDLYQHRLRNAKRNLDRRRGGRV
jgi:hypothetical protein